MSNSICKTCGAMLDPVPKPINNAIWLKCRGCGFMKKENRRIIKPLGK